MLVVDKAAGLVVHPAAGNWSGTLLNALLARDPASAALPRAGIVHRLDKDTSGLMVVGRNLAAVTALMPRHRRARGRAPLPGDRRTGLRRARASRSMRRSGATRACAPRMAVVASGKPARTDFELLASGGRLCRAALHPAQRSHAPDPRPPGGARPAAGRRSALWRRARARHGAPGACTPAGWPSASRRRGRCCPSIAPRRATSLTLGPKSARTGKPDSPPGRSPTGYNHRQSLSMRAVHAGDAPCRTFDETIET